MILVTHADQKAQDAMFACSSTRADLLASLKVGKTCPVHTEPSSSVWNWCGRGEEQNH